LGLGHVQFAEHASTLIRCSGCRVGRADPHGGGCVGIGHGDERVKWDFRAEAILICEKQLPESGVASLSECRVNAADYDGRTPRSGVGMHAIKFKEDLLRLY